MQKVIYFHFLNRFSHFLMNKRISYTYFMRFYIFSDKKLHFIIIVLQVFVYMTPRHAGKPRINFYICILKHKKGAVLRTRSLKLLIYCIL